MNRIRESMEGIRASRELKADTLRYLEEQRGRRRPVWRRGASYALVAAMCLLLMLGVGWHNLYGTPISYISMDVNPSIELGINRYGRVVATEAYNEDGQNVLGHLSLKNKPYVQAVRSLLEDEVYQGYLADNAMLVFTIISDSPEAIREGLDSIDAERYCQVLTYTSDSHCMEEAHRHEMSFGKYRAYLELAEYDRSVTIEDCHGMTMVEIQDRIAGCRKHEEEEHGRNHEWDGYTGQDDSGAGQSGGAGQDDSGTGQNSDTIQDDDGTWKNDEGYGGHRGGHHDR